MTNEFIERVIREGIVDTKKYRYMVDWCRDDGKTQWAELRRIPLADLGTTKAINGWETLAKWETTDEIL